MPTDRTPIAIAVMAAGVAGYVAVTSPAAVPALTLAVAVFLAALAFLKLL
jgi:hypothetical protein